MILVKISVPSQSLKDFHQGIITIQLFVISKCLAFAFQSVHHKLLDVLLWIFVTFLEQRHVHYGKSFAYLFVSHRLNVYADDKFGVLTKSLWCAKLKC